MVERINQQPKTPESFVPPTILIPPTPVHAKTNENGETSSPKDRVSPEVFQKYFYITLELGDSIIKLSS